MYAPPVQKIRKINEVLIGVLHFRAIGLQGYSVVNQPEQYLLSNVGSTSPLCNRWRNEPTDLVICVLKVLYVGGVPLVLPPNRAGLVNYKDLLQCLNQHVKWASGLSWSIVKLTRNDDNTNYIAESKVFLPDKKSYACSTRITWSMLEEEPEVGSESVNTSSGTEDGTVRRLTTRLYLAPCYQYVSNASPT